MSEKRIAHLLGNGPSKEFFNNTPTGDVYGCNYATEGMDFKKVFIHDRRPWRQMVIEKKPFPWKIVFRGQYKGFAKDAIRHGAVTKEQLEVLPPNIKEKTSGHDGIWYLLFFGKDTYDELHLWGFDSLTKGICDTDSKERIRGSNPHNKRAPMWKQGFWVVFNEAKKKGKVIYLHHNKEKVERVA
jgi:hypothetical protein